MCKKTSEKKNEGCVWHKQRNYAQGFEDGFNLVIGNGNKADNTRSGSDGNSESEKVNRKTYKYVEGFEYGINLGLKYLSLKSCRFCSSSGQGIGSPNCCGAETEAKTES